MGLLLVLAQVTSGPTSTTGGIVEYIQYGVLGLVVVGFLIGFIWARPAVNQLIKDKEAAEKQRDELIKTYENKVIPLLQEVDEKLLPAVGEVLVSIREMKRDLDYFYKRQGEQ